MMEQEVATCERLLTRGTKGAEEMGKLPWISGVNNIQDASHKLCHVQVPQSRGGTIVEVRT